MTKHKRGTVGWNIQKLVAKYGNSVMGIYTLTEALKEACRADSIASVQIGGVNVHQTPGYQSIQAEEQKFWATVASLQNPAPADSTLIESTGNHDAFMTGKE